MSTSKADAEKVNQGEYVGFYSSVTSKNKARSLKPKGNVTS